MNSREATPLYQKLRDILRKQVEDGRFLPGQAIPSERDLCQQYQISRITVRQAIAEMINEGVLYRQQGKGTFVARRKVNQGLSRIVTFRRTVMDIGMKPSTRILFHGLLPAGLEVANILKLPDAGQVLKIVLLGQGDDHPLVVYESYFPPRVGKKMLRRQWPERSRACPSHPTTFMAGTPVSTRRESARPWRRWRPTTSRHECSRSPRHPPCSGSPPYSRLATTRRSNSRRALYRGDYYKFNVVRDLT